MRRLELAGLLLTLAAVAVLAGSLVTGLRGGGGPRPEPPASPDAGSEHVTIPTESVRVEVLNGAGVEGLARSATHRLRDAGFDVVYFGNAAGFGRERTQVIDRVGRPQFARAVARALGGGEVSSEPDADLYLEVTVILGADWSPQPSGE